MKILSRRRYKKGFYMHDFYQKKIMDHYHNSPYRGFLENAYFVTDEVSPSCGDHVVFSGICEDGAIVDLKFKGEGSILGQAAASLLCEYAIGKPIKAILDYSIDQLVTSLGLGPDVVLGPTRLRTIVFVLETLQKGVRAYVESRKTL